MIIWLLTRFLSAKTAEALAPFAKWLLIGLAFFAAFSYGVSEGKEAIRAQIAEKVAEAREKAMDRYFAHAQASQQSYDKALQIVAESRAQAPQIIREIRNAPPTACSHEPVGDARIKLLNAAIVGPAARDSETWGPAS